MRVSPEYISAYLQKTLYKTAMFFLCFVLLQHGRYPKKCRLPFWERRHFCCQNNFISNIDLCVRTYTSISEHPQIEI